MSDEPQQSIQERPFGPEHHFSELREKPKIVHTRNETNNVLQGSRVALWPFRSSCAYSNAGPSNTLNVVRPSCCGFQPRVKRLTFEKM